MKDTKEELIKSVFDTLMEVNKIVHQYNVGAMSADIAMQKMDSLLETHAEFLVERISIWKDSLNHTVN